MRLKQLFIVTCVLLTSASFGQYNPPDPAAFQGVIVETYYVSDSADATDTNGSADLSPGGETTYRVFIDLLPGYELLTVGGFVNHDITFSTTTSFYHNDDRGEAWGGDINESHYDENTVAIDSWLSMGAGSENLWGVLKAEDTDGTIVGGVNNDGGSQSVPGGLLVNDVPVMGGALTTTDGLYSTGTPPPSITSVGTAPTAFNNAGGNFFSSTDFAWAVLGGVEGPTPENKILIGQFTTDGIFTFCLNLWVKIPDSLVCGDPNCHEILEFYGTLLASDTAGGGFAVQNKFTHPSLCFNSGSVTPDCLGVPGGPPLPGTNCDDGDPLTQNDVYDASCVCVGEDCLGVLGGTALPGAPCDDGSSTTINDVYDSTCTCAGIPTGMQELAGAGADVQAHPNPVKDLLLVEASGVEGQARFAITDALGRTVITTSMGHLAGTWKGSIDVSGLNAGVYFLELVRGEQRDVLRFTKQ